MDGERDAEKERERFYASTFTSSSEKQFLLGFYCLGHPFLNLICNFDAIVDNKSRGGNEIFFLLQIKDNYVRRFENRNEILDVI